MNDSEANKTCKREDIAAYLDGEMGSDEIVCFENHLKICKTCAEELQSQKSLLNELDFAFGSKEMPALPLPKDFTKVIKTTAENDMNGLRQRKEKSRALRLCLLLSVIAFLLLGWARMSDSVLTPVKNLMYVIGSFLQIVWRVIYDAALGVVVVTRAINRHFIFESNSINYLLLPIFLISLILLTRLVRRYYRA